MPAPQTTTTPEDTMAMTLQEIATVICRLHDVDRDHALTTATAYAIQLDLDVPVQEGGQAPDFVVSLTDAEHIVDAYAAAVEAGV